MDSGEDNGVGENKYDWSELKQPTSDTYQFYVFLAHLLIGIIISVLSFSEGWVSWGTGIGALTPFLLAITGGFYLIATGINWYRNEFIPYLTRVQLIPEFETDSFLKYQRIQRFMLLVSGYISLVISQYVWTWITTFMLTFPTDIAIILEVLSMIYIGVLFFHAFVLILFFALFDTILRSIFSDIRYIAELEDKMQAYFKEKQKAEKEAEEARKKAEKESVKPEVEDEMEKDSEEESVEY
ncbi:MAG: hypothetical protein PVJ05_11920 [Candidatus Thorarchaeota archaeon]|jgi:hypothetical protein